LPRTHDGRDRGSQGKFLHAGKISICAAENRGDLKRWRKHEEQRLAGIEAALKELEIRFLQRRPFAAGVTAKDTNAGLATLD
jgi:hypothetical protein